MNTKNAVASIALAAGLAAIAPQSHALQLSDDLFLQLDLTAASDYRTRGISQTQGDPALQAGAVLGHASGLYLGAWTSNVDFGFDIATRQEVDYFGGWYWQPTEAVALDLGYIKYTYPKSNGFNQSETYAVLSAYGFKAGAFYSSDAPTLYGKDQDTLYSWVGYETQLPLEVGLELRYGEMDFKDAMYWSSNGDSRDSYNEWEAKLTREFVGVKWGLSYVDTGLSDTECASFYGFDDVCSPTVVASASKRF